MQRSSFLRPALLFYFSTITFLSIAQEVTSNKMAQLEFMVGEWIGISKTYDNGKLIRQVPAYESVYYDLDSSLLVLQFNSETLQLHTIIYFDDKKGTYSYNAFSKRGVRPAPAILKDGKLIVQSTETKRFIFTRTEDGGFREYGEKLIDGKWVLYFQDDFRDTR